MARETAHCSPLGSSNSVGTVDGRVSDQAGAPAESEEYEKTFMQMVPDGFRSSWQSRAKASPTAVRFHHENRCAEGLNVKGMQTNPSIVKNIRDVGGGDFLRSLEYKGRWYRRPLVPMGGFDPSSQRRHTYGHRDAWLPRVVRYQASAARRVTLEGDANAVNTDRHRGLTAGVVGPRLPVEGTADPLGTDWADPGKAGSADA